MESSAETLCSMCDKVIKSDTTQIQCKLCLEVFSSQSLAKVHVTQQHNEIRTKSYPCKECKEPIMYHLQRKHYDEFHPKSSRTCHYCDYIIDGKYSYHFVGHFIQKYDLAENPSTNVVIRCPTCCTKYYQNNSGKFAKKRNREIKARNNLTARCALCPKIFDSKTYGRDHLVKAKKHANVWNDHKICPYCDESIAFSEQRQHFEMRHFGLPYFCPECDFLHENYEKAKEHYADHFLLYSDGSVCDKETYFASEDSYLCDKCNKDFGSEKCLKGHEIIRHDQELITNTCLQCTLPLWDKALEGHTEICENIILCTRDYKCIHCPCSFARFVDLVYHAMRWHDQDILKTMALQQEDTQADEITTTRCWKCKICEKQFGLKKLCIFHIRKSHKFLWDRFDACAHCNELMFNDKLSQHYKNHHPGQQMVCPMCQENIDFKTALNTHYILHFIKGPKDLHTSAQQTADTESMKAEECKSSCSSRASTPTDEDSNYDTFTESRSSKLRNVKWGPPKKKVKMKFTCEECGKQFPMQKSYLTHMIKQHKMRPIGDELPCLLCREIFDTWSKMDTHFLGHFVQELEQSDSKDFVSFFGTDSLMRFQCTLCHQEFKLLNETKDHIKGCHSQELWDKHKRYPSLKKYMEWKKAQKKYQTKKPRLVRDVNNSESILPQNNISELSNQTFNNPFDGQEDTVRSPIPGSSDSILMQSCHGNGSGIFIKTESCISDSSSENANSTGVNSLNPNSHSFAPVEEDAEDEPNQDLKKGNIHNVDDAIRAPFEDKPSDMTHQTFGTTTGSLKENSDSLLSIPTPVLPRIEACSSELSSGIQKESVAEDKLSMDNPYSSVPKMQDFESDSNTTKDKTIRSAGDATRMSPMDNPLTMPCIKTSEDSHPSTTSQNHDTLLMQSHYSESVTCAPGPSQETENAVVKLSMDTPFPPVPILITPLEAANDQGNAGQCNTHSCETTTAITGPPRVNNPQELIQGPDLSLILPRHLKHACTKCGVAFSRKDELMKHTRRDHGRGNLKHPCTICGVAFSRKDDLRKHTNQAHGRKNLAPTISSCPVCGKEFKVYGKVQKHFRDHFIKEKNQSWQKREGSAFMATVNRFQCALCEENFRIRSKASTHLQLIHAKELNDQMKQHRAYEKALITDTEIPDGASSDMIDESYYIERFVNETQQQIDLQNSAEPPTNIELEEETKTKVESPSDSERVMCVAKSEMHDLGTENEMHGMGTENDMHDMGTENEMHEMGTENEMQCTENDMHMAYNTNMHHWPLPNLNLDIKSEPMDV